MPNRVVLIFLFAASAILAACEEKPQELHQTEARAEQRDQTATADERRQRTLGQSESNRIYNQGGLR
jgi:hypothetical protein